MATRATTVEVTMPQMGESVTEGTVLEWLKQVGDQVAEGEPLVEISTDKVDTEIPAPVSGTLSKILVEPDQTAAVGAVLAEIEAGEGPPPAAEGPPPAKPSEPEQPAAAPVAGNGDANATPVAARVAAANGVDLSAVPGSGPRGRVTKEDVLAAIEGDGAAHPRPSAPPAASRSAARRPRSSSS